MKKNNERATWFDDEVDEWSDASLGDKIAFYAVLVSVPLAILIILFELIV